MHSTSTRQPAPKPLIQEIFSLRRMVKLLIAVSLMFYTCYLPFGLYMMIVASNNYVDRLSSTENVMFWNGFEAVKGLMYARSSLNPVLYAFQSFNYRNGFKMSLLGLYRNRVNDSERNRKSHRAESANRAFSTC